nr:hypothetical protein [Tanacetum cinerariifolium]
MWTDPEDGMVYIDVPANPSPAPPVQTPPSPEWTSGSFPISLAPSIVHSHMISLTVPSSVATLATANIEGFLTRLGAQVEMQGGLIRDHKVRLGELSLALFDRPVLAFEAWAERVDTRMANISREKYDDHRLVHELQEAVLQQELQEMRGRLIALKQERDRFYCGKTVSRGLYKEVVRVEYEWMPPHCIDCIRFGHDTSLCPKRVCKEVPNISARDTKATVMEENDDGFKEQKKSGDTTGGTQPSVSIYNNDNGVSNPGLTTANPFDVLNGNGDDMCEFVTQPKVSDHVNSVLNKIKDASKPSSSNSGYGDVRLWEVEINLKMKILTSMMDMRIKWLIYMVLSRNTVTSC